MSETVKRILSGLVLTALTVITLRYLDFYYYILPLFQIGLFAILGVLEFYRLTDRGHEGRPLKKTGILFTILVVLSFYAQLLGHVVSTEHLALPFLHQLFLKIFYPGINTTPFVMTLFVIVTLSIHLIYRPLDGTIYSVSATIFGVLYAAMTLSHTFLVLSLDHGLFYMTFIIVGTTMTDIGAYFAGRWFGKHNAGLKVSPRKTFEGYAGGYILANLSLLLFSRIWGSLAGGAAPLGSGETVIIGIVLSTIAVFGDLSESALKRDAKLKDSASLIPGHGGALDLNDALLYTIPIGYYYFYYKSIFGFIV